MIVIILAPFLAYKVRNRNELKKNEKNILDSCTVIYLMLPGNISPGEKMDT